MLFYPKQKNRNKFNNYKKKRKLNFTLKPRYKPTLISYNKTLAHSLYLNKKKENKYLLLQQHRNKKSLALQGLNKIKKINWNLLDYYLTLNFKKAFKTEKIKMQINWAANFIPYIKEKHNKLSLLRKNISNNLYYKLSPKFKQKLLLKKKGKRSLKLKKKLSRTSKAIFTPNKPKKISQTKSTNTSLIKGLSNTTTKKLKINKMKKNVRALLYKKKHILTIKHNKKALLKSNNTKLYSTLIKSRILRNSINKREYNFVFESITLRNMLDLKFHIGCKKKYRNRDIEHFYGAYNHIEKHSFLNINLMIINLRKGLNFIRYALIRNSQLMLVSWSKDLQRIPVKIYKQSFFFKGPWFPGFLSNFRNIRHHGSFWFKEKFFPKKKKRKQAPLTTLALSELGIKIFPNVLFTFDSLYVNESVINEALFLRMPSVAFINPTQFLDISRAIYPIVGSCATYSQGKFFIYLIAMLLLDISLYRKARVLALERV